MEGAGQAETRKGSQRELFPVLLLAHGKATALTQGKGAVIWSLLSWLLPQVALAFAGLGWRLPGNCRGGP